MFERIKNFFRKGGAKIGMVQSLQKITDHPKIAVPQEEYQRIEENIQLYRSQFDDVEYVNSEGELAERPFHSLNVPKVVSKKLAKLVFNEGCAIEMENDTSNDFLQDVFNHNKFRKNFGEQLEAGYAIGGLVLRPYVDTESKRIKISHCLADAFYPLQSNTSDVSEAAIATVTRETEGKKTIYYTLLEFHEWRNSEYWIRNELYRSERKEVVGVQVPLDSLDKYKDLEAEVQMKNFSRPLFIYIKLAGKNNVNLSSPLSLGVIDNAKRQIKDINEKYDEFMWEIEEARRKILASDHFFKVRFDEKGKPVRRFDSKTSVYQKLKTDEPFIDEFVPSLRAKEFIESINFILRTIELQTGFSAGTFSFDGHSVKTATEIISENSETFSTRSDNVLIVSEALKELVITIFELAAAYGLHPMPQDLKVVIDFDDGVFESQDSKLNYYGKAVTLKLMPQVEAIQRMFGLSEETAQKWVKLIRADELGMDPSKLDELASKKLFGDLE
ncbi:phage portal protein [Halalkalibacterium halodurans]|uniref:phage portal protein n=1 Tax=Halalkalibacterium halodurans TaxID=86665 RepID=UPI0010FD7FFD|nr:phage portal protein [Halalkalibacterium halodurans]